RGQGWGTTWQPRMGCRRELESGSRSDLSADARSPAGSSRLPELWRRRPRGPEVPLENSRRCTSAEQRPREVRLANATPVKVGRLCGNLLSPSTGDRRFRNLSIEGPEGFRSSRLHPTWNRCQELCAFSGLSISRRDRPHSKKPLTSSTRCTVPLGWSQRTVRLPEVPNEAIALLARVCPAL